MEFIVVKIFGIGWVLFKSYYDFSIVIKGDVFSCYMISYRFVVFCIDYFIYVSWSCYKVFRCNIFISKGWKEIFIDKD